jgi:hypothetical protein
MYCTQRIGMDDISYNNCFSKVEPLTDLYQISKV